MPRTTEEVMGALRAADAAGNTEDARKLAIIADRMRKAPQVQKPKAGFFESMAVGTEQTLAGLPTRMMRETGILPKLRTEETQKLPEYMGRGIGEVASFLLPGGLAAKTLTKAGGLTGQLATNIYSTMVRHPWLTMASELTGGVGMGVGERTAEVASPKSQTAKELGRLAGGMAGGAFPAVVAHTPTMLALKTGKSLLKRVALPFTEQGAKYRAGEYIKSQVSDPSVAAKKAVEKTIGELPPTIATGEKRLVAIYKDLLTKDPIKDAESVKELANSFYKLESEMRKMGYGAADALRDVTEKRIASLELNMDKRVAKAVENAQRKLNAIPVADRKYVESRIVREELETIMRSENELVRDAWKGVPKHLEVGMGKTKTAFNNIVDDLSTAERIDIPRSLRVKNIITGEGTTTTLKEMQGLRSKLLEEARIARSKNEWNKARISEDISDAILEDLDVSGESGPLKIALSATRKFKERFQRGIVGKVLGYGREGAPAISPDLTLDIVVGRGGVKGATDLERIAVTERAMSATKKYVARSFTDYALDKKTGILDPVKSAQWIKNNEPILDKLPDLRASLLNARKAQELAKTTAATMAVRKKAIRNPKISMASRFLNANVGNEVESILKSKDPIRMINQLSRQARKDPTGNSMEGLKAEFINHALEKSTLGSYNEAGERTLSGHALNSFLKKHYPILKQIFSFKDMSRMNTIGNELSRMEMMEQAGKGIEIKMEDIASNFLRLSSRIGGAQIGRMLARVTGGGTVQTPGIMSERFKNIASRLTKDRSFQLISDAILSEDGKLLQSLLQPITKPGSNAASNIKFLEQRMNLWLISSGARVMDDIINDVKTETKGEK